MMAVSMTKLMMPAAVFSMTVLSGLRAARYSTGVVRVAPHLCTARYSAGVVRVALHLCAARYSAIMVCMPITCSVRVTVFSVVHMCSCFRTSCYVAYAMAVFANLCTAVNSAKTMLVHLGLCATWHTT